MKTESQRGAERRKTAAGAAIGLLLFCGCFLLEEEAFAHRPGRELHLPSPPQVADSLGLRLLGRALHGSSFCTAVQRDRVYVGAGTSFMCFDVSQPADPVLLGFLRTAAKIWNISLDGDTAYVANDKAGLAIIDCAEPLALEMLGSFGIEPGEVAYGVHARSDTAWVACGAGGVRILDCRNPANPSLVSRFNPWGFGIVTHIAVDIQVLGSLAFVAYADIFGGTTPLVAAGLGILDCTDPTSIDTIGIRSLGTNGCPRALFVTEDSLVCVAGGFKDLFVFDCSDPESARVISTFVTEPIDTNYSSDVWVQDGLVYLGDGYAWTENLLLFDIPSPDSIMNPVGSLATRNITWGLSVADSIAYIAEEWGGLSIVDCTDPGGPVALARRDIGGYAQGVFLEGSLAYIACEGGGLQVVDCADPRNPLEVSAFDTRGRACSVWAENDTAYVAEGFDWVQGPSGLEIIDLTDIENPVLIGSYDPGDSVEFTDIHMVGDTAYIANARKGLRILDCSTPEHPITIGAYDVNSNDTVKSQDIFVEGTMAYLAYHEYGLWIFDCTDPSSPVPRSHYETPTPAVGVHVAGKRAYVACAQTLFEKGSLRIFDCSDPDSIREMGSLELEGSPDRVDVRGSLAFVAAGLGGLRMLDCSHPFEPEEIGFYVTADFALDLAVRGDTVYIADSSGGLFILEFAETGIVDGEEVVGVRHPQATVHQNFPNPFNPTTLISYSLAGDCDVELVVYDILGRRVRTLVNARVTAGEHRVSWDGRDERGSYAASGTYLLSLRACDSASVRKLLLLR